MVIYRAIAVTATSFSYTFYSRCDGRLQSAVCVQVHPEHLNQHVKVNTVSPELRYH